MRVALRRVLGRVRQGGHNVHQPFGTTRSTATGGAAHDAVAAEWPVLYHRWRTTPHLMRFPNGESLQELVARAADALRLAIEKHPTEAIVMVGHDSVNRAMLLQALDQPYLRIGGLRKILARLMKLRWHLIALRLCASMKRRICAYRSDRSELALTS